MAKNKKSFLLYCDLIHTVEQMPIDKAGELFMHILKYVNDMNPVSDDLIINLTFEPIKQHLKRDLKKYENICERNKINGSKGGRPKKEEPKKPTRLTGNQEKPKKADNDNDNDNDNDSDINKKNIPSFEEFKKHALSKKPKIDLSALKNKYDSWIENDWKDGNNREIKNWKSKLTNTVTYIPEIKQKSNFSQGFI